MTAPKRKSILLYDFMAVNGGAEKVTLDLFHHFDELDVAVGFVNRNAFPDLESESSKVINLGNPTQIPGWQTIKVGHYFEKRAGFIKDYDTAIFSGSNAPLAVLHRNSGLNILYCHTPPRFVYDLKEYYFEQVPLWQKVLLKGLIRYFQPKYEKAVARMDIIVANSQNVRKRIKKYLDRDAIVVYPPCDINKYKWIEQGDYYLSTARLEPYKRVDLVVKAFMRMPDKKLIVTSGGSELTALRALAAESSNIVFTGWCSEEELKSLVGSCIATLYVPVDEDFGMSPVESMSAGKPVIGVNEGGVKETILDGVTGVLCPEKPTVEHIVEAVSSLGATQCFEMRAACEERAQLFSPETFFSKMETLLKSNPSNYHDTVVRLSS